MAARLGILMLDTRFPRIVGDVGNAQTWPFEVLYHIVPGATPAAVVCENPEPFVRDFIAAGRELIAQGCTGIATTCGFLSPLRARLAQELGVPVAASSLEQAGLVQAMLGPGSRIGILTISGASLGITHLRAAGVPDTAVIAGMDHSGFATSILGNSTDLDVDAARIEMIKAAHDLIQAHPDIGAIVLECTNMAPYADDIARALRLPVFSIYTYLMWFHEGLCPSAFPGPGLPH
jgi:Asp/Glu/hydantoin racemase